MMDTVRQIDWENYGFHRLQADSAHLFRRYLSQMEPGYASTMSFASLMAWRRAVPVYYMEAEGFLQAAACDTCHGRIGWLPIMGDYRSAEMGSALAWQLEKTRQFGIRYVVTDVSGQMLPYYKKALPVAFWTQYDDGDSDYVYALEDFKRALDTQDTRYNYNYFVRKFEPVTEVLKPRHLESCRALISQSWCCLHCCDECGYGCQKDTAACIISEIEQSGATGIAVFSMGQMVGYCIVSQENGQIIFLFKKTKRGVRGINEFIHRECIDRFAGSADKVNYTEDMNIEGLRYYKQRLCQYELIPRYTLMEKKKEA
ncbi:MAG: DUF2156 domain-containing protein [Lachnospiraceae bacterium]|nr:DUF2156 domain-containing protein [Lachnospiraceae bacterium]